MGILETCFFLNVRNLENRKIHERVCWGPGHAEMKGEKENENAQVNRT